MSAVFKKLAALRAEMRRQELDVFIVARADQHQGEDVAACCERLAWVSGFTGSAGLAAITLDQAALFVDGRYVVQVREQVPSEAFVFRHITREPVVDWLRDVVTPGCIVGFDPWLHTTKDVDALRSSIEKAGASLRPTRHNPIDAVWSDRPPAPLGGVVVHDLAYAGESAAEKRARIAAALSKDGIDAAVLSAPASLCWLLNIRGSDLLRVPSVLAFSIIHADESVDVFLDQRKLNDTLRAHMGEAVRCHAPNRFEAALAALGGKTVRTDAVTAPWIVGDILSTAGAVVDLGDDPCALPRACKNAVEVKGARAAHVRDGAAMVRFLSWIDSQVAAGSDLSELSATNKVDALRAQQDLYRGPSFDAIFGAGEHAALPHYHATENSNLPLSAGPIFLADSGGHYLDGTTDLTRVIAVGVPTDAMRQRVTLVLKGHIALSMLRFPEGTTGAQIDAIARQYLWSHGLDYDHGTGHGVGSFLSVHEGPQSISKKARAIELGPGMILSNEPGFYEPGKYGVRIENLLVVQPVEPQPEAAGQLVLEFSVLTLVPIDRRLIDLESLTAVERAWLDAYHRQVFEVIGPRVDGAAHDWLAAATRPLGA